jgi:hypothetical protein
MANEKHQHGSGGNVKMKISVKISNINESERKWRRLAGAVKNNGVISRISGVA